MSKTILTVVSEDYYQYYIPLFVWSIRQVWPEIEVMIYVRGKVKPSVLNAGINRKVCIIDDYKRNYQNKLGLVNTLRFLTDEIYSDEVLITDIDMFFCPSPQNIFDYYKTNILPLMLNDCYVAHHGPYKKPWRPEVHGVNGWTGDFERIGGGFVLFFPKWWEKTRELREYYDNFLKGAVRGYYRELDEVILCKMVKKAGLPVAPKIPFPRFLRQLHFGDFKDDMKVRYEDRSKMRGLLDIKCVKYFLSCLKKKEFQKIMEICRQDSTIDRIMERTIKYCEEEV